MEQERNQRSKEFTGANNAHEERMCPTEREIRDDSMIVHGGHLKLCCRPRIMCISPMTPFTQLLQGQVCMCEANIIHASLSLYL
jgi:hypothetical protein